MFLMMPHRRAIIWSLLLGYLVLPIMTQFNFPGVPNLDKDSIPCAASFVVALLMAPSGKFKWPRSLAVNLLMIVFVISPILTGRNNQDFLIDGNAMRQGMTLYDALSLAAGNAIAMMPFLLGAGFLRDERSHRDLVRIFVIAGLAYSVLMLWEVRFSPRLETQIYNVGSGEYFMQQMRGGGFRSKVFLGHGLLVSTFCAMTLLASIYLWRTKQKIFGVPAGWVVFYLSFILILNKSAGAMVLAGVLGPLVYWLRPRRFALVALVFAAMIVTYPALRGMGLIPTQHFLAVTESMSAERANSLSVRIGNEDMLLNRAAERPWFGWGGYGRNRVFMVTAWGAAWDATITDGTWIIIIGTFGWVGYFAEFGLLCYPFWQSFKLRNRSLSLATITLGSMHLLNLMDLIPNSSLRPITWLLAGALSGAVAVKQSRAAPRFAAENRLGGPKVALSN
jgi:hypothetical protein